MYFIAVQREASDEALTLVSQNQDLLLPPDPGSCELVLSHLTPVLGLLAVTGMDGDS